MKTVLITGSSGFLGGQVTAQALEAGYSVIGIDKNPMKSEPEHEFKFIQADINDLSGLAIETKIDFVVHTASSLPYGSSKTELEINNINAAKCIAEFAKEQNAFLVEIGSSSVYGKPQRLPVDRNTPLNPLDRYAKSKLMAEQIISGVLSDSEYCIIRPRTILGFGRGGIFSIFFTLISKGIPLPLPNSGRQIIQFVHVKDLAALSLYMGSRRVSGIWPAASPEPKALNEYLRDISNQFGVKIRFIPFSPRLFAFGGKIAYRLRLTKFTPWHFGAFPHDNWVDTNWKPLEFSYKHTSTSAFMETYITNIQNAKPKRSNFFWIGKQI